MGEGNVARLETDFKLMEQTVEAEKTDRREWCRRAEDRMDRLEFSHLKLQEVVVGKDGSNGLSSKVHIIDRRVSVMERVGWLVFAAVVGTAVKVFFGG